MQLMLPPTLEEAPSAETGQSAGAVVDASSAPRPEEPSPPEPEEEDVAP